MGPSKRLNKIGTVTGLSAAVVVVLVVGWLAWPHFTSDPDLQKWAGPAEASQVSTAVATDPADFAIGAPSRMAIFLTRRDSSWLPLVHGLKAAGVPIRVVEEVSEATRHSAILVYPAITAQELDDQDRTSLRQHVGAGGLLITTQVWDDDLADLFGFTSSLESRLFAEVSFIGAAETLIAPDHPFEKTVRIGNPERQSTLLSTQVYSGAVEAWAAYPDGSTAIATTENAAGGRAIALGIDLGFWASKAHADRDAEAERAPLNGYDPSLDIWMRLIKSAYLDHQPNGAVLHTVPGGKALSVVLTFDIPGERAVEEVRRISATLRDAGQSATFFVQTNYAKGVLDKGFFSSDRQALLRGLRSDDMSIASHSVSHPETLAPLPGGTGRERFPNYPGISPKPGASLLGELRVSKHLLQSASESEITAYRPGQIESLSALPQLASAVGYNQISTVSAADVMTYWPYRTSQSGLGFVATDVFQFPIALSDRNAPFYLESVQTLVDNAARFGGALTAQFTNPDTDISISSLETLLSAVDDRAWIGGLDTFGAWWQARDQIGLDVRQVARGVEVSLTSDVAMNGVCVETPEAWVLVQGQGNWYAPGPGAHCTDVRPGRQTALFALR